MEEFIKVSGKTVEQALMEAAVKLGTSRDNIEYRVIEKETKGFLGIGAKQAVIEARKKKTDEEFLEEVLLEKKVVKEQPAKPEKKAAPKKKEEKAVKEPKKDVKPAKNEKAAPAEKPAKPVKEKKEQPVKKAPVKEEAEPVKKEVKVKAVRTPADDQEAENQAVKFLTETIEAMGLNASITCKFEGDILSINLEGDDMGILIGKRGQTLDSLQYLTSLVVNKGKASYVRVKIDTENYRERRRETLENLARNIAFKVKKTRRSVFLEPMNPNERRIIHSALQNDPYVTTHSEGDEPNRKVVITLKKRTPGTFSEQTWDDEQE